ncbi:Zn-ribbon domain-containing OB-fold protein [Bryobacter aggregatus]|uniref:Zn-ribbon domain-containing OB-fold protein n=1 Tax=Bryobacter aggregatus TaxID=360054 RepID=UPI0004E13D9D|nr:OB-fold domain-containing protein [Bryobacter aggregatus]
MTLATVYTETVIHSAPERFAAEAPYQIALVEFENQKREMVRIIGERVSIGDRVEKTETGYQVKK